MPLAQGMRFGAFEIQSAIGAGGMGEVYRARDPRLGRDVAVKVLPALFASDPERVARFEREAKTLAALNHPNIGCIYGLEEANGLVGLVLELVEGPTLADRIAQGPIPLDEALSIAAQIADGLAAAHDQGVVHRDLKPSNIKIRPDGTVKVLDFGLAKPLATPDVASGSASESPTITTFGMTQAGTIIGTAAYMAPEQVRGKAVDRRSDIWAFGCVLYEMLTGRRLFQGEDVNDILVGVLRDPPEWQRLPPSTPEAARRLLRRSLEKDPQLRLADIRDARLDIQDARANVSDAVALGGEPRSHRERMLWASALALVTLAAAGLGTMARRPSGETPEIRYQIATPATRNSALAVSPDGRSIVFATRSGSQSRLWLQSTDSTSARPLPQTEGGTFPFWSPDGRSLGFFAASRLTLIDISGGTPRTLPHIALAPLGQRGARTVPYCSRPAPAHPYSESVSTAAASPP